MKLPRQQPELRGRGCGPGALLAVPQHGRLHSRLPSVQHGGLRAEPEGGAAAVKLRPLPDTQLSQTGEWLWRGTGGWGTRARGRGAGGRRRRRRLRSFLLPPAERGLPVGGPHRAEMDPNRIIQALKGTIDPKLRIAAENELNQVRGADAAGGRPAVGPPRPAAPHGVDRPGRQGRGVEAPPPPHSGPPLRRAGGGRRGAGGSGAGRWLGPLPDCERGPCQRPARVPRPDGPT